MYPAIKTLDNIAVQFRVVCDLQSTSCEIKPTVRKKRSKWHSHLSAICTVIHTQRIRGVSRNALYKSTFTYFTYLLTYYVHNGSVT